MKSHQNKYKQPGGSFFNPLPPQMRDLKSIGVSFGMFTKGFGSQSSH